MSGHGEGTTDAGGVRSFASAFFEALTRPLPRHIADFRESARTALIFAALVIVLGTLWIPQAGAVRIPGVLLLSLITAATGVVSMMPAAHAVMNRYGGVLTLLQIVGIVWLTGGPDSIYSMLYVMLLLYAALFYDTMRLIATGVLILVAIVAPYFYGGRPPHYLAELLVTVPVWAGITGTVHWLVHRIRTSAQTDGLTGLWNHVTFWRLAQGEHERMLRHGSHYSVLMLDLDHFKKINDTRGHSAGDDVLRQIAEVLTSRSRASDIVARYGGEEFAMLLPETHREQAVELAKELRMRVLTTTMQVPVTVSIGVASSADGLTRSAESVVAAADRALYEAKRAGRNHVAVSLPGQEASPV
ncbi:MAG TPA: GGDEF domain-containing protein [Egibacteraceae bacterium]|nr:GGDEF domain-containing protein [Egibacteraceae bacterium]